MKKLILLFLFFSVKHPLFVQAQAKPIITVEMENKFKVEIEKQIPALKKQLMKGERTEYEIEFIIDTFRINQLVLKRMDVDFTTQGMNYTIRQRADSYDKLLNKYYSKLLTKLEADARKILIASQKAWILFRDNETKLIWTIREPKYSGGGTIQTNIATGHCAELTIERTIVIFNYYSSIMEAIST